jgi:DNA-binding NarL/FixJ family response regulator
VKECTVKHHLSSVFDKVFSRLQLAVFAIHHHLVEIADFLR